MQQSGSSPPERAHSGSAKREQLRAGFVPSSSRDHSLTHTQAEGGSVFGPEEPVEGGREGGREEGSCAPFSTHLDTTELMTRTERVSLITCLGVSLYLSQQLSSSIWHQHEAEVSRS